MNAMDCESYEHMLIDLVGGSASADAAHPDASAHVASCPHCTQALRNMEAGLILARKMERLEPPASLTENLLRAAAASASSPAKIALAHPIARPKPSLLQPLLDFVGRFAMARQVGMVTITLLVVAVGLWSLPQLKPVPAVTGGIVLNPDTSGEAGPAPGLQPADRLDLKVDMRAGRIRSKEEEAAERAMKAVQPVVADGTEAAEVDGLAALEDTTAKGDPAQALDDMDAPLEQEADAPSREKKATSSDILAEFLRRDVPLAAAPAPAATPTREEFPEPAAMRGPPAVPAASSAFAAPPPPAKPGRSRAADEMRSENVAGTRAARPVQTALGGAAQASSGSVARSDKTASATSRSSANECDPAAFSRYERIVASAGRSAEAGDALLAMARCRTQQGQPESARTLLERASRVPAVASRARALLARATRLSAPAAAAPTSAPARSSP
jgi:hypothetical protein